MGIKLYRLLEKLTGQTGKKCIPYKIGQAIKVFLLTYIIKG